MGMMLFSPSFPNRSQMKRTFLPFKPMLPSASARFITNGMSTRVESAAAMPIFAERLRKVRREKTLKLCINHCSWNRCVAINMATNPRTRVS